MFSKKSEFEVWTIENANSRFLNLKRRLSKPDLKQEKD